MISRTRVVPALASLVLLAGLLLPTFAGAEGTEEEEKGFLARTSGAVTGAVGRAGSAVGDLVLEIVDFIVPTARRDDDLDRALETYANGHYFTTWVSARRLLEKEADWLSDEASFLAGLAAAEAGAAEEAVPRLLAVLDAEPVSPYYAVALGRLLELEERIGHDEEAARVAAAYLADFWKRPRSPREAAVKAIFLETGNFVEDLGRETERSPSGNREIDRHPERTTDRAIYLAGLALLRVKDFERAAVCFDALTPASPYYSYARYGYAQASYGLHEYRRARLALSEILSHPGQRMGEVYLRDRAALLSAQILNEIDEDAAAIRWLREVSSEGPFGLHAAILAAEIQAEREKPALALVYLKDRPSEGVEPKLVAQAAALDASLHRDLADTATAIARLEEGLGVLEQYESSLRAAEGRLDSLLGPLEKQSRSRSRLEAWRRRNVSNAVPDLLEGRAAAGWGTRMVASLVVRNPDEEGYPVIYHRRAYDPFAALPMPRPRESEPPGDRAFPSLFRRSLGDALSEALEHDLAVRAALEGADAVHLAMLVLDGELRLRAAAPTADDAETARRLEAAGFGEPVIDAARANRPRSQVLAEAIGWLGEADAPALSPLREEGRAHLERWRDHERNLVRQAVEAELRAVQEIRYVLEFELSQTLATQGEQDDRLLQGTAPTSSLRAAPLG